MQKKYVQPAPGRCLSKKGVKIMVKISAETFPGISKDERRSNVKKAGISHCVRVKKAKK